MRRSLSTYLILAIVLIAGCSRDKASSIDPLKNKQTPMAEVGNNTVRGKVTCSSGAISSGRVIFFTRTGLVPAMGVIQPDGSYEATSLPEGEAKVCLMLDPRGKTPIATRAPRYRSDPREERHLKNHGGKHIDPPSFVETLMDFKVTGASALDLHQKLHEKYWRPSDASPIVNIGAGMTMFDIHLDI